MARKGKTCQQVVYRNFSNAGRQICNKNPTWKQYHYCQQSCHNADTYADELFGTKNAHSINVEKYDDVECCPEPDTCVQCTDVPPPYHVYHDRTCLDLMNEDGQGQWDRQRTIEDGNKCIWNDHWRTNHYCMHTCFHMDMGYSHIKCCGNLGSYAEGGEYVDQPACTVCEDTPSPALAAADVKCRDLKYQQLTAETASCHDVDWKMNKYCQLSCHESGVSFPVSEDDDDMEICCKREKHFVHNIDKTTIAAATDEVEQCALDCSMCDLSECGIEDEACMISDDGQSCESAEVDEPGQYPEEMYPEEEVVAVVH